MAVECESTRLVRSLYPNVSAFAAGDPPQRGGSRTAFEASSFDRKTIVLPAPYTFSLSRVPTTRVSNTYRETFDFAQRPPHTEGDAADVTPHAVYAHDPREVDFISQPESVLHKEYPFEPHKPGSLHQRKACGLASVSSRPPAPQPPYRTDDFMFEADAPSAKKAFKKCFLQQHEDEGAAACVETPQRRVQMAETAWDSAVDNYYARLQGAFSPSLRKSCLRASPSFQQPTPEQETAGRRSTTRSVSFVCRAHRGRHIHLLDLPTSEKPSKQGRCSSFRRSVVVGEEGGGKGVHRPNCCSAFMMLRRCGCNEAELPARAEFVKQPQMTREPRFEESVNNQNYLDQGEAWMFQQAERDSEKEAQETPQNKARRLGLDFKYFYRNYSDPKLLYSG